MEKKDKDGKTKVTTIRINENICNYSYRYVIIMKR